MMGFTFAGNRGIMDSATHTGTQAFFMPQPEHNRIIVGETPPARRRKACPVCVATSGPSRWGFAV